MSVAPLTGKKVGLLVDQQYQEIEFWYPRLRFEEAGAEVVVIGPEGGVTYQSKLGYPAKSDIAAEDVVVDELDALIVPGGFAPDFMRRSAGLVGIVRDVVAKDKVLGALCHAGWLLASANVLRDRTVTSFFSIKDDLVNAGATWVDEAVVTDGKLITSRLPDDLPKFCATIIDQLSGAADG